MKRLFDFIAAHDLKGARERLLSVRHAFDLLAEHPLLGRLAEDGRRVLVLPRGRQGYIANYRWLADEDAVPVLAVRQQREAGLFEE